MKSIPQSLIDMLNNSHTDYEVLDHAHAPGAQKLAQSVHMPGRDVAKAVLVRDDEDLHMVVLPADHRVNINRLKSTLRLSNPRLATEHELAGLFPDCEIGAMPAFGNLYGMQVALDAHLVPEDKIAFAAGNHKQSIRLSTSDFIRLADPVVVDVGEHL